MDQVPPPPASVACYFCGAAAAPGVQGLYGDSDSLYSDACMPCGLQRLRANAQSSHCSWLPRNFQVGSYSLRPPLQLEAVRQVAAWSRSAGAKLPQASAAVSDLELALLQLPQA